MDVLLFFLLLAAYSAGARDTFVVGVFNDRYTPPARLADTGLPQVQRNQIRALWVWSHESFPQRVEMADVGNLSLKRSTAWLEVRIVRAVNVGDRMLLLRAAPTQMWEEVPEDLLPSTAVDLSTMRSVVIRVPVDGKRPWRLRLEGTQSGTWWQDIPPNQRTASLSPAEAADRRVVMRSEEGTVLPRVRLSLLDEGAGRGDFRKLSDYRSDDAGRIVVHALPAQRRLTLMLASADRAPVVMESMSSDIPDHVVLPHGSSVEGKLSDRDGHSVANATVTARMWTSDLLPIPLMRSSSTNAEGHWQISALPSGKAEWESSADGFADTDGTITLTGQAADLGTIILKPAVVAELAIIDDRADPVPAVALNLGSKLIATSDQRGHVLVNVAADESLSLRLTAVHHLTRNITIEGRRAQATMKVVLPRAFHLTGRFVDTQGTPLADGHARASQNSRFDTTDIRLDGTFEFDLESGIDYQLNLTSARSAATSLKVMRGSAGEIRDLGDVVAPRSMVLRGRLIREKDASIVAGARIWLPRPSESGPLMAWAFRDLLETTSDADGRFELSGAPQQPFLLRIEAPALAPVRRAIAPEPDTEVIDLGDISVREGTTVTVDLDTNAV